MTQDLSIVKQVVRYDNYMKLPLLIIVIRKSSQSVNTLTFFNVLTFLLAPNRMLFLNSLSEWTPIFNTTTSKVGPFEASKVPDFIVKFTQKKEVDKILYYSVSVQLYNAAGDKIGWTNFIQYPSNRNGKFKVGMYKRTYIPGSDSCSRGYLTLDYLTDYNFEMRTSATQADMFQFTTSDGVVHNEDMSSCDNYSAWQDVLSRTEYADLRMYTTRSSDVADYVTTEYKVEEN